jgi:protein gp37
MEIAWARAVVAHCREAEVPVFVKQVGVVASRGLGAGPKGGDWDR